MKERPILFSAPMVRAILAGTKTQTRRAVKGWPLEWLQPGMFTPEYVANPDNHACPYGQPGDRLRVKEAAWMWCERVPNGITKTGRNKWHYVPMREAPIHYAADRKTKPAINVVSPGTGNEWGWRLKIGRFLPRWASRIDLEVTAVRVERLNDISTWDAGAEGVNPFENPVNCRAGEETANQAAFRLLWGSINGADSWAANPWVWVVEFRQVKS